MQKSMFLVLGLLIGGGVMWFLAGRRSMPEVDRAAAERGQTLYQVCAVCHGENGEGNLDTQAPKLAGQYGWYLERQLQNFRAGLRGDSADVNGFLMKAQADGLPNDQAVSDVVAYIGTLRP